MSTKKKWVFLCLAAVLLCCFFVVPMDARAESGTCGEDLTWTLTRGTLTISGTGDMYDYTGSDNAPWFSQRGSVTKIKIGTGVTHIGDYAFRNCAITSLTIPGNVKSIGKYAFRTNQSLKELVLEDGVESLGTHAFAYCSSLATIKLTSSVKLLAERAVFDCPMLTDVYYVGTQAQWNAMTIETGNHKFTGVIRTLSTARGTCGDNLNWDLINGVLTISGTGDMYSYDDPHAPWFSHRGSIKKIKIGEDVTSIGDRAFRNCAITEITIPGNVKTIGQYAFRTCDSLKTVTLEEGVQTIEANAFTWCDTLEIVRLPASVKTLEDGTFFDCDQLKYVYYNGTSEQWATVSVGGNNEYFLNAHYCFTGGKCGDNLTWQFANNTLTITGKGAMYDYPDRGAPWYPNAGNITTLKLSDDITAIGDYAFQGCQVTEIDISPTVKRIGDGAFMNCEQLTAVTYDGPRPEWDRIDIGSDNTCLTKASITIPPSGMCGDDLIWMKDGTYLKIRGTGPMYDYSEENPAPWSDLSFMNIQMTEGITTIGDYAFWCCGTAHISGVPSSVRKIGSKAFPESSSTGFLHFCGPAPEIAPDAFAGFKRNHDITVGAWPEEAMRDYGGNTEWNNCSLIFPDSQNLLFGLNESMNPEDFEFKMEDTFHEYIPQEVVIGEYDNASYGLKTVKVFADGQELSLRYFVTDGQYHLDMVKVEFDRCVTGKASGIKITAGDMVLRGGGIDYYLSDWSDTMPQDEACFTIEGRGNFAGLKKTYTYSITKMDIGKSSHYQAHIISRQEFQGIPLYPAVFGGGEDFQLVCENNVNMGTGQAKYVGIGNYYGHLNKTFEIADYTLDRDIIINGNYIGQADGTLSDDYYYLEKVIAPGKKEFFITASGRLHVASFQLYEITTSGQSKLVDSYQSQVGYMGDTSYHYDFSHIYEGTMEEGGKVYMLSYAWRNDLDEVYAGVLALAVPAKVPKAQTMYIEQVPDDEDFRRMYFDAWSPDGDLGLISWRSSNSKIATVDDGVVTFLKPGTVTITGSYGGLSASQTVTTEKLSLNTGILVHYYQNTGKADVVFEHLELEEGKDYTVAVTEKDGMIDVIVTGCGLFEGTILRQFETRLGEPVGHTYVFNAVCDPSCETCDFVRESVHTLTPGWKRDAEGHWHMCRLCGEQQDYEAHTFTDPDTCGVCGGLNLPGDMNNDYEVTDADALYLLRHTLFEDSYPITRSGDFNNDGMVTDADALYLLRHTLFPEEYPIH